jgi:hypothetical protein
MAKRAARRPEDKRLFTLRVILLSGPMTEEFLRKNKTVSRTIRIRGDQTLDELHWAIYGAFDREEEHLYQFEVGGKKPMDRRARYYVHPEDSGGIFGDDSAGKCHRTSLGSIGLNAKDRFFYWFDFGDDWWHRIDVLAVDPDTAPGNYPVVSDRVGDSPPQYPFAEEDEYEDAKEDEEAPQ